MKLLTIPLEAGKRFEIGRGKYLRVFKALYPFELEIQTLEEKQSFRTDMIANIGAEFPVFAKGWLTSDQAQTVQIAISERPIFDNRLGADDATAIRIDGNTAATGLAAITSPGAGSQLVIPQNLNRKSLTLNASAANTGILWVGGTAADEGIPLEADDTITLEVKGALNIWATALNDKLYGIEVV